jgi:hypothetical protein
VIFGFLLRPDSEFSFAEYLSNIQTSSTLLAILLILAILNCLLLVRIQSFYLAVLAMAQYTTNVLRPRVTKLAGAHVLDWDEPGISIAKDYWLPVRAAAQIGFGIVAIALSLLIAITTHSSATTDVALASLYVVLLISIAYVCFVTYRIAVAGRHFHRMPSL